MKIKIIKGDITKVKADYIVNAANNRLLAGGGVCGAIYAAAGTDLSCRTETIMWNLNNIPLEVGTAVLTPAYNIKHIKGIIHTVGPIYIPQFGEENMEELLEEAYTSSLEIAKSSKAKSIAFPAISTGIYGFPMDKALKVVKKVLEKTDFSGKIILVCFSDEDFKSYKSEIKPWEIMFTRLRN